MENELLGSRTRREFIGVGAAALALAALGPGGSRLSAATAGGGAGFMRFEEGKYVLPDLPYAASALEPAIDARTMEIHHGKHHAGYTNNLNAALGKLEQPAGETLERLLGRVSRLDASVRDGVRNNGGGYYNHCLFWETMGPGAGGEPKDRLGEAIKVSFGSFAAFREQMSAAAATRFGSGWAWLYVGGDGKLYVSSTPNQDNPLMRGLVEGLGTPILGLDVWEHAYYLNYQNRRADYVAAWWSLVNWTRVGELYAAAKY